MSVLVLRNVGIRLQLKSILLPPLRYHPCQKRVYKKCIPFFVTRSSLISTFSIIQTQEPSEARTAFTLCVMLWHDRSTVPLGHHPDTASSVYLWNCPFTMKPSHTPWQLLLHQIIFCSSNCYNQGQLSYI